MEAVDPRVNPRLVHEGSRPFILAEHQEEYQNLPCISTPDGQVITRWAFTPEERRAVFLGEDLYVTIMSIGPINPLFITVGPVDWTKT